MAHRGYIALLLAVAAVALGACGSDDESGSKATAAGGTSGPQGTTSTQTRPSGTTGAERARPKRTAPKERSDQKAGTDKDSSGSAAPEPPATLKQDPKARRLTAEELQQIAPNQYAQARELCRAQTLEVLAQYYGIESRDPDKVARKFAADYIPGLRQAVTDGCKAGLLASK